MNYNETISFLFSQLPMFQRIGKAAYKANLNNTIALDKYFDHPHKKFKSIHVAGTNGKGSVSHMLASVLQTAGYKVGLYTSPHLSDFRERIRINGEMIEREEVVEFVNKHKSIIKDLKPSFFEITVAMAFHYFARKHIDIAVIEVGLGGRLDSTNIINPELSIITNIGYDHMSFLGNSLQEIANEKAGIIKTSTPVIIGETQIITDQVFVTKANNLNSDIYFADKEYHVDYSLININNYHVLTVKKNKEVVYLNIEIDLLGEYQKKNVITTISAIHKLKNQDWQIEGKDIYSGLKNVSEKTGLLGRWQIIKYNPLIVCDTAHNIDGIRQIVNQINNTAFKKLHIIFGMVDDKSINSILTILPKNAIYYFTKASVPRALDEKILAKNAKEFNLKGSIYPDVKNAIVTAINDSNKNDMIYIGGSTFIVADALEYFNK